MSFHVVLPLSYFYINTKKLHQSIVNNLIFIVLLGILVAEKLYLFFLRLECLFSSSLLQISSYENVNQI